MKIQAVTLRNAVFIFHSIGCTFCFRDYLKNKTKQNKTKKNNLKKWFHFDSLEYSDTVCADPRCKPLHF